jgi:hypothetical protein
MKKLLKESEIRKMMKFANIGALTDTFVDKLNEGDYYEEDDPMAEELSLTEEEEEDEDLGPEPGPEEPLDDESALDEPMDEPLGDEGPGDLGGTTVEAGLEGLNAFLEAAIEHPDEIREKVNVELTDEPALDEPLGDEPALDEPLGDEPALDMGAPDEMSPDEELEEAQIELEEDDTFVNEVVRRVARRLLKK